ncbi:MAG: hypothetical protein Ct9H300mP13_6770 [Gammaproteobacteria bacterium]|nr:MAG: hypothetical protein Ct9H300mP13_6770 [Gammaproteobacteria bacterium]
MVLPAHFPTPGVGWINRSDDGFSFNLLITLAYTHPMRLADRVVIVTGGAAGMGLAFANVF